MTDKVLQDSTIPENGIFVKGITFVDEHDYIDKCKAILEVVGNLRLKGETGTGKTTLVHRLAEILDMPLFEVGLTRNVTSWDLLGCDTLKAGTTELREGIILQWLKNKNGGILYLDGFNYADPSMICLLESLADFRGCAEEHSLVVTQRGIIEIRKVKKGDKVLTHDEHGTRFIKVERIFKFSNVKEEFIKIITKDGKQLIVSKDHKIILNNFREVEAKDLNIGDTVNIVDTYEENNQRFVQKSESDKSATFANSIRIFSWLDRRRGFNNDNFTKSGTQKSGVSTIVKYLYNKYFYQSNDVAKNFRIQNTETKSPKSKMERLLYSMSRRIWNVAIAQTSRTTFNNQTKAMPISNSIHRNTVKYGTQLAIYGTRYSDSETSETTQHTTSQISYKASLSKIVKIEKFYGTLNYVDLTTENHKYFANGILIHNSVWIPEIGKTFVRTEKHYLVISYNPSEKAGYCLTEDMMITTPSKFETIRLISKNNYVFNECNQKDKVTDTNTRNYKGKLYTVKAKSILPISSSDDHTFIVAERTRKIIKNPTWTHKKNTYEYQIVEKLAKDLKAYRKEDYGITSTTVDTLIFPKHKIETETQTPLDLAWLYGLFIADGSTNKNDNKIAFCLGSHEKDLIKKVAKILETHNYNYYFVKQTNETRIVFTNKKLRDFLKENFGTYAENKHIPQFIMDSTKEITKAFLEGYIDGDGSVSEKQTQIKTVSKELILGLQRLYSKLDILLSIQTIQPKNTKLTEDCKLQLQYLGRVPKSVKTTQDEQNFYLPIVKITTKDYDGTLYDITTEKHLIQVNNIVIHQSGTFLENIATIRRFEGLVIDYLTAIQERNLIKSHAGNYDFACKIVEIGRKTRTAYKEGKLRTPLTTGNLLNYAKLFKHGMSEEDIIEIASSLFPDEEINLFRSFFESSDEIDVEALKKKDE